MRSKTSNYTIKLEAMLREMFNYLFLQNLLKKSIDTQYIHQFYATKCYNYLTRDKFYVAIY